ncbi:MAG: serine dehydratase subunit alpha family protein [Dehalococcoidia bacterium]|nr:serine dehydratase subunit alpha family protein [Dehalococcoidia bacterium]
MPTETEARLVEILKLEVKPALGVTEAAAVALAAACAYRAVGGEILEIAVEADPGLYKNGISVMVPGTDQQGSPFAAAIGALGGVPEYALEVLKDITQEQIDAAKRLVAEERVHVDVATNTVGICVDATVRTDRGVGRAIIKGTHDNVVLVEADGKTVQQESHRAQAEHPTLEGLKFADLFAFARNVDVKEIRFLAEAASVNQYLAQQGLDGRHGAELAHELRSLVARGILADDLFTQVEIMVAAACDARMGGVPVAAMSVAGSGSHGITAVLPLVTIATKQSISEETLIRAIALSCLTTIYIKSFSGRLSAFCGCAVAAATGAAAGLVLLLGGDSRQAGYAIRNIAADVTGIVCDGANFGCALKISTGARSALRATYMALDDQVMPSPTGLAFDDVDRTIINMGKIASPGMEQTNHVILDLLR